MMDRDTTFVEFILVSLIFFILLGVIFYNPPDKSPSLIKACESTLPRDQHCVLKAVPEMKETKP